MVWGCARRLPIGRDDLLRYLEERLNRALDGDSLGVLLEGDAGIGKSTLLFALADRARERGSIVASGACLPVPGLPYAPAIQILRSLEAANPERGDEYRAAAAHLMPLQPTRKRARANGELRERRPVIFEQFLRLVAAGSGPNPAVIAIEDLQWIDPDSAVLLLYVLRNAGSHGRLVFLGTERLDISPPPETLELIHECRRTPGITRVAVPPLAEDDATAHATELARAGGKQHDESQISAIVRLAEGNPFYLEELVLGSDNIHTTLPSSLMHGFRARFARLPLETQELLRTAAVGGRRVDSAALRVALARSETELAHAIQPAIQAAFVRLARDSAGEAWEFRHALVREAILADVEAPVLRRIHRRFAQALEGVLHGHDAAARQSEVAHHWEAAAAPEAFASHIRAGKTAMRIHAYSSAELHLDRAVDLWRNGVASGARAMGPELLCACAEASYASGRVSRAAERIREAIALVDAEADPLRAGVLYARLSRFQSESDGPETTSELNAEALRLIPADPPTAERAMVLNMVGARARLLGRYDEAIPMLAEALTAARATGATSVEVASLCDLGLARCLTGELTRGLAALDDAIGLVATKPDEFDAAMRFWPIESKYAVLMALTGELEVVVEMAVAALDESRRRGDSQTARVDITANLAEALYLLGRWDEALSYLSELGATTPGAPVSRVYADAHLAQILASKGDSAHAVTTLESVRRRVGPAADPWLHIFVEVVAADIAAWELDLGALKESIELGRAIAWPSGGTAPEHETELVAAELFWHGARAQAESLRAGGRVTTKAKVAAAKQAGALARMSRSLLDGTTPYGPRWRTRLTTLVEMTEQEAAAVYRADEPARWNSIVEAWRGIKIPYLETYARYRLAQSLLDRRRRAEAAVLLIQAHRRASDLGAEPLRGRIEDLAQRSRTQLASDRDPTAPALTDAPVSQGLQNELNVSFATLSTREREVAALLAEGRTNREIAERIFITERTAAAHVSNILGKLGVSRRTEAAALWHRNLTTGG